MDKVRESYDRIADAYAAGITPVDAKPFDCTQLDRFLDRLPAGAVWDIGCGPGDATRYLGRHRPNVTGIDLSADMIRAARQIDPNGSYRVDDMARLELPSERLAGIVAFYSLIHLEPRDRTPTLTLWREALAPGGRLLVAVHEGTGVLRLEAMLDRPVELDFHFFSADQLNSLLIKAGFLVTDVVIREPYPAIEAQTRRIYAQAVTPEGAD